MPAFFGFGVVWHRSAPWADALAQFIGAWDRNPLLGRLEENRVHHLATSHARAQELQVVRAQLEEVREENATLQAAGQADPKPRDGTEVELARLRAKIASQEGVLRALLDSGGLRVADRISALRHPRRDWSWPGRLRTALGGPGHEPDHVRPAPHQAGSTGAEAPAAVTWESDERCVVAGITFQAMPPDLGDSNRSSISMEGADFLLFKPRPLIERYEAVDRGAPAAEHRRARHPRRG